MLDLRILLIADSAAPLGMHAQSLGLEAALQHESGGALAGLIARLLRSGEVLLDASAVARAYGHADLVALDAEVTARRVNVEQGRASRHSGRRLAQLAVHICDTDFCRQVRNRASEGNLGVVQGSMTAALGLPVHEAVLIALNRAATALVMAAVRLGQTSATSGQRLLTELEPTILDIADEALAGELSHMDRPTVAAAPRPALFQT